MDAAIPTVTSAIAGARSPRQIQETVHAGDITLPEDVVAAIEAILTVRTRALA